MARLTPMFRQYLELKEKYPDAILFFRLGDFYEMFFEDAKIASRILDITLTSRDKGAKEKVPMCGVPAANAAPYINRLVEAGYKVAICEQVEDPRKAKGLVRREVIRVVTPGLNVEEEALAAKENQYLAAVLAGKKWGLSYLDLSTGDFRATEAVTEEELLNELFRLEPKELLLPKELKENPVSAKIREILPQVYFTYGEDHLFERRQAEETLKEEFKVIDLSGFGFAEVGEAVLAAAALLRYVHETQKVSLTHLSPPRFYHLTQFMVVDETTKRNLELLRNNLDGSTKGSLLSVLDKTLTPMGGRLLKQWLLYPLREKAAIEARLQAVAYLVEDPQRRRGLSEALRQVLDLERLLSRAALRLTSPRDLLALAGSLKVVPEIRELLPEEIPLLAEVKAGLKDLGPLVAEIEQTISPEAPANYRDGGFIREGVHEELDELRRLKKDGLSFLAELEARERERTGIPNLKVGYNRVFGYYLEVSKSHLAKVPPDYIRKQTLVGGERFITPELKEFEAKVLTAEERIKEIELELFSALREKVLSFGQEIRETAKALAVLDVVLSLAEVAVARNYVRPQILEEPLVEIREGRHPVVEVALGRGQFVPNSLRLDREENTLLLITGPNMAGKSTILRQTALIVLMAHVGSFVPAEEARIGLCDRIFTRVGASDQLSRGRSTFMVEMSECANILHQATERSLVVLDEIGRGTSTYDGLAIAWAVAEFLLKKRIMTLFATHYHELTELAAENPGAKNFNVAVKAYEEEIIFLYRLLPGPASESYGVQVAALAGLPKEVVKRAREILKSLEGRPAKASKSPSRGRQKTLFQPEDTLRRQLLGLDPDRMTPLEALQKIYQLRKLAERL